MHRDNLFWGLILIFIGSLFLADNLGYISFSWGYVWPALLILFGFFILLGRSSGQVADAKHVTIPLDGASEAQIRLEHGAGRIKVTGGAESGNLISGDFTNLDLSTNPSGITLKVHLRTTLFGRPHFMFPWNWSDRGIEWNFALNENVPISIDLDSGASEIDLDLRNVKLKYLDLDTGASSTKLFLPEKAGFSKVDLASGAASHEITIPEGVAADIHVESGLSDISINESRFPLNGKHYTSPDYASAANRVELNIETGVSSVKVI
jgi:hypothetical protein